MPRNSRIVTSVKLLFQGSTAALQRSLQRGKKSVNNFISDIRRAFNSRLARTFAVGSLIATGITALIGLFQQFFSAVVSGLIESSRHIQRLESLLAVIPPGVSKGTAAFNKFKKEADESFRAVIAQAKELSAQSSLTFSGIVKDTVTAAQAGLKGASLLEAQANAAKLAVATGTDFATALRVLVVSMNAYQLEAKELKDVTEKVAATFSNSGADVEKINEAFKFVASSAANVNLPIETTLALIGKLVDSGQEAGQAGRGLAQFFTALLKPSTELQDIFEVLGFTVRDFATGSKDAIDFLDAFIKAGGEADNVAAAFGTNAARVFGSLKQIGADSVDSLRQVIVNTTGEVERLNKEALQSLGGHLDRLKSQFDLLIQDLGESGFTGTLKGLFNAIRLLLKGISGLLKVGGVLGEFIITILTPAIEALKLIFQPIIKLFKNSNKQVEESGKKFGILEKAVRSLEKAYLKLSLAALKARAGIQKATSRFVGKEALEKTRASIEELKKDLKDLESGKSLKEIKKNKKKKEEEGKNKKNIPNPNEDSELTKRLKELQKQKEKEEEEKKQLERDRKRAEELIKQARTEVEVLNDELEELHNLRQRGLLTEEEYNKLVAQNTKKLREQNRTLQPLIAGFDELGTAAFQGSDAVQAAFKNIIAQITTAIAKALILKVLFAALGIGGGSSAKIPAGGTGSPSTTTPSTASGGGGFNFGKTLTSGIGSVFSLGRTPPFVPNGTSSSSSSGVTQNIFVAPDIDSAVDQRIQAAAPDIRRAAVEDVGTEAKINDSFKGLFQK